MADIYNAFGKVPSTVPPECPVRHWDDAMLMGAAGFAIAYLATGFGLALATNSQAVGYELINGFWWGAHYLTAGIIKAGQFKEYVAHTGIHWRLTLTWLIALAAGLGLFSAGITPREYMRHVDGPRLLRGKDSIKAMLRTGLTKKQREQDKYCLPLHPDFWIAKKVASLHAWIVGSVGSGKTQVMLGMLRYIFAKNLKVFIYDVKGDFTAKFAKAAIVSPFDARSYIWWVARDVRTPSQAAAFIDSLIPEDNSSGKFWTNAARQVAYGVVLALQNDFGETWTWRDLADALNRTAIEQAPVLLENYRKAYALVANAESQSTAGVISTLSASTRLIDDLATAWPDYEGKLFSITDWVKDGYKGPRQVITQQGTDATLSAAYIAAMINVSVTAIINPQFKENETGRFLGFFLDELATIGKLNIGPLIDKGRSKGVVTVLGFQDIGQLKDIYGENQTQALLGMMGTPIVCRMNLKARDEVAELFGTNKVAVIKHGGDGTVATDGRSVVFPHELTNELGFAKGKQFGKEGWGIRAIVAPSGQDPMILNFPGINLPDKRAGQVPAKWTTQPRGKEINPPALEEELSTKGRAMTEKEIAEMLGVDLF